MSKSRTGMENSRNTADPRSMASGPTVAEMERVAMAAEINAVRKEYALLLQLCNAVQLSFLALARVLQLPPEKVAQAISNESANKAYEADAVRELSKLNAENAARMAKIAKG